MRIRTWMVGIVAAAISLAVSVSLLRDTWPLIPLTILAGPAIVGLPWLFLRHRQRGASLFGFGDWSWIVLGFVWCFDAPAFVVRGPALALLIGYGIFRGGGATLVFVLMALAWLGFTAWGELWRGTPENRFGAGLLLAHCIVWSGLSALVGWALFFAR